MIINAYKLTWRVRQKLLEKKLLDEDSVYEYVWIGDKPIMKADAVVSFVSSYDGKSELHTGYSLITSNIGHVHNLNDRVIDVDGNVLLRGNQVDKLRSKPVSEDIVVSNYILAWVSNELLRGVVNNAAELLCHNCFNYVKNEDFKAITEVLDKELKELKTFLIYIVGS